MRQLTFSLLLVLGTQVQADAFDDFERERSLGTGRSVYRDEAILPAPSTERYFGGNDPAVVVPILPGSGSR
jgi:hypothetical protein